jgi:hypothetical protein
MQWLVQHFIQKQPPLRPKDVCNTLWAPAQLNLRKV